MKMIASAVIALSALAGIAPSAGTAMPSYGEGAIVQGGLHLTSTHASRKSAKRPRASCQQQGGELCCATPSGYDSCTPNPQR